MGRFGEWDGVPYLPPPFSRTRHGRSRGVTLQPQLLQQLTAGFWRTGVFSLAPKLWQQLGDTGVPYMKKKEIPSYAPAPTQVAFPHPGRGRALFWGCGGRCPAPRGTDGIFFFLIRVSSGFFLL